MRFVEGVFPFAKASVPSASSLSNNSSSYTDVITTLPVIMAPLTIPFGQLMVAQPIVAHSSNPPMYVLIVKITTRHDVLASS